MLRRLLLAFVVIQLADLYALFWLGRSMGFWSTFALLFAMGMLGSAVARREGLRVWQGWHAALDHGRAPEEGIVGGMLVLLGSLLLVAPGLGTDVLGFILLFPITRRPIAAFVSRRLRAEIGQRPAGDTRARIIFPSAGPGGSRPPGPGEVIDTTGIESPPGQLERARTE
jgi:UPF0716 protein FxsA